MQSSTLGMWGSRLNGQESATLMKAKMLIQYITYSHIIARMVINANI